MRVLMFGWEFPPHIAGGLGTACYGMTRGLARNDVDVTFVMPKASGDEDQRFVDVVNASDVEAVFGNIEGGVEDIIDKIQKSERIEITGPNARAMGHGLALYGKNAKYLSDILFVETDKAKLDAFDPQEE